MPALRKNANGFTLVELAIVLVIIGLIIGGILAAQSMISSAKIQNAVKAIQQFDIALSNFKTSYKNQLPGDSNLFSPIGDNDGELEDFRGCCGGYFSSNGASEQNRFWTHLQQAGFQYQGKTFSSTYSSFDIDSATPNAPKVALDIDAGVLPTAAGSSGSQCSTSSICYAFGNWKGSTAGFVGTYQGDPPPVSTNETALAIDTKIDNKVSATGIVQSYTCGTYNTAVRTVSCNLYVQSLSQTGNGQ